MPDVTADIVTVSHDHQDHNNAERVKKTPRREPFVISAPGEYEIAGVFIFGFSTFHDEVKGEKRGLNTAYLMNIDGLRLVHLGDLGQPLSEQEIESLGDVDVLFVPVGGEYTLDARQAAQLVNKIEPRIVIPMHYLEAGVNEGMGLKNTVEDFVKEIGTESQPIEILNVLREKLPDEREVVVLKRK